MAFAMQLKCARFGNTDIDISTWLKIFDILLKTEEFICAALLLYSANKLSSRLPFAIYLKSVCGVLTFTNIQLTSLRILIEIVQMIN